ncbi:MAG: DUF1841 family protein, partial [Planctomycetes bacterium]|nr:DUF1841 family protein [Planctomycetota bacterium]
EPVMQRYDPLTAPDPDAWLALDESERTHLVGAYHKRIGDKAPSPIAHAAIHTIIENQLAEGLPPVVAALERLMDEGLDRHEALHAIGTVLSEEIFQLLKGAEPQPGTNERYYEGLAALTAAQWLAMRPED